MRDDYNDSSGMTLHYTPKLRPNSAVMLMVGQWYLEIPPGRERHAESAVCSKEDTHRLLTGPIKIVRALNHMHYLGTYTIRTGPIKIVLCILIRCVYIFLICNDHSVLDQTKVCIARPDGRGSYMLGLVCNYGFGEKFE